MSESSIAEHRTLEQLCRGSCVASHRLTDAPITRMFWSLAIQLDPSTTSFMFARSAAILQYLATQRGTKWVLGAWGHLQSIWTEGWGYVSDSDDERENVREMQTAEPYVRAVLQSLARHLPEAHAKRVWRDACRSLRTGHGDGLDKVLHTLAMLAPGADDRQCAQAMGLWLKASAAIQFSGDAPLALLDGLARAETGEFFRAAVFATLRAWQASSRSATSDAEAICIARLIDATPKPQTADEAAALARPCMALLATNPRIFPRTLVDVVDSLDAEQVGTTLQAYVTDTALFADSVDSQQLADFVQALRALSHLVGQKMMEATLQEAWSKRSRRAARDVVQMRWIAQQLDLPTTAFHTRSTSMVLRRLRPRAGRDSGALFQTFLSDVQHMEQVDSRSVAVLALTCSSQEIGQALATRVARTSSNVNLMPLVARLSVDDFRQLADVAPTWLKFTLFAGASSERHLATFRPDEVAALDLYAADCPAETKPEMLLRYAEQRCLVVPLTALLPYYSPHLAN